MNTQSISAHYSLLLKSFRMLFNYQPWRLVLLFLLTLLLGAGQGFTIILLIPFLQLLEVGTEAETNSLVGFFADISEKTAVPVTFESVLLAYLVLLTLIAVMVYGKFLLQSAYQQGFTYQMRRRLFRKIIMSDWPALHGKSRHNHLQVLTEEVPKFSDYYYIFLQLLTRLIITGALLFYAFLVSPRFTVLVMIVGMLAFMLMRRFLARSGQLGRGYVKAFNRLLKYIDDFWVSIKVAKVHSSEGFHCRKFESANNDMLKLEYQMNRNYALPQLLYKIAAIVVLVAVIYVGYRVEQIPLASFFILIVLFARSFPQFISINNNLNLLFANMGSVQMVLELDTLFEDRGFPEPMKANGLRVEKEIDIKAVHFGYPGNDSLFSGLNASIPANSLTGIIGESGRGKTTLVDLIAGLQQPQSGHILLDGKILDASLLPRWKNSIGYLPQDAFFIDGSLRENLLWDNSRHIPDEEIFETLDQVNARELVSCRPDGLDAELVNYPYCFSGGELQRLALARVLLRKPHLLILDEATSSLDLKNETQILEVISQLKQHITIIFITHRKSVFPFFDNIISL